MRVKCTRGEYVGAKSIDFQGVEFILNESDTRFEFIYDVPKIKSTCSH